MRKVSIPHRINDNPAPSPPAKMKALLILAKTLEKQKLNLSPCAPFHTKTRLAPNTPRAIVGNTVRPTTRKAAQKANKHVRRILIILKSLKYLIVKLNNCEVS